MAKASDTTRVCGRRVDTGETVTLALSGGRIATVEVGATRFEEGGPEVWLSPGFCDLQLNGFRGADFNRGRWRSTGEFVDALAPRFDAAARAGTALLCPCVVTGSRERMEADLRTLAAALAAEPALASRVPAIHLEGPYLSAEDGPRGAHPLEWVRDPDWEEFELLQEAAEGRIRMVTLAPERPGALRVIEQLVEGGVVAALGHTGAEPETIRDAVAAGATVSTHLGNGAHGMIRRHPNYLWEQLASDDLIATVIVDGHHLPPAVVKCIARAKGAERLAVVSDAIALGGLPPGRYNNGRHEVLPSGKVVVPDTPYLVGAAHLLDWGVANLHRFSDLTLGQACCCAATIPARILGLQGRKGGLEPGQDADLTLFRLPPSGPLKVVATVCAGEVLYAA